MRRAPAEFAEEVWLDLNGSHFANKRCSSLCFSVVSFDVFFSVYHAPALVLGFTVRKGVRLRQFTKCGSTIPDIADQAPKRKSNSLNP